MKRSQLFVSLVLAGLAAFLLIQSWHLSFGSMRVPQTGFFPTVLAILLLILAAVLFGQGLVGAQSGRGPDKILPEGWSRIGLTLAAMIAFALVLESLGFLLSTFFLMILLLRAIESTGAQTIWVTHGSVAVVVRYLREKGYEAEGLATRFSDEEEAATEANE